MNTRGKLIMLVAIAATALVLPLFAASAGVAMWVWPATDGEGEPDRGVPTFGFDLQVQECAEAEYAIWRDYYSEETSEEVDTVLEVSSEDGVSGTFQVPDLQGGTYWFVVSCPLQEQDYPGQFSFSRLLLTKTVEGVAPDGTTFTVSVACPDDPETTQYEHGDVAETRDFPATGGGAQVVLYEQTQTCTVTETEDGGADSTAVDPVEVAFTGFGDQSSTILNTFDPDPEPSPSPTPTEEDSDVDDTVDEAEPAEPVEAEPDYTG